MPNSPEQLLFPCNAVVQRYTLASGIMLPMQRYQDLTVKLDVNSLDALKSLYRTHRVMMCNGLLLYDAQKAHCRQSLLGISLVPRHQNSTEAVPLAELDGALDDALRPEKTWKTDYQRYKEYVGSGGFEGDHYASHVTMLGVLDKLKKR